ncbi:acid protease [Mollisia scopiformis]|uniref:Acid protease n=1 Tax=Mollisia scopiformis TaxID=149040 RepID=A0A194XFJ8_MOLSC|nr:acid protease [Mollisia scopiformis]KUJ18547.1 acid protease [Mollisia scopiformis]
MSALSILLVGASLLGSSVAAGSYSISAATASSEASELTVSSHVLELSRKTSAKGYNARSAAFLLGMSRASKITVSNHTSILESLFIGEEFATNITFGTETFESIVDTGSSDTWVVESGFECVDVETSAPETEAYCDFGPVYNVTDSFQQIPDENFNITYGDGEFLTGVVGYETVTLAGITVNQTVALVNYAAWEGDNTTSGLIGLAYPALTSAYAGTDPTLDNSATGEQIQYSPIFKTMYTDGLVSPLFSLAILRDISGDSGYLALGGLPPVNISGDFTSTPILITNIEGYLETYDFYTINIDGITIDGRTERGSSGATQYIVDSGTTLNYFPTRIADAVNDAFVPPAIYDEDEGAYIVDCSATPPSLGIVINGTTFYTNPLDMILLAGTDEAGDDVCITGIDDGGSDAAEDVYILGDTFQKNVVTVFDVGAAELQFAAREYYPSNDPVKA